MRDKSLEDLLPRANWSIYRLVRMAAKRALELSEGKPALVKTATDKVTTIALEEIAEGKVEYNDGTKKSGKKEKLVIKEQEEVVEEEVKEESVEA